MDYACQKTVLANWCAGFFFPVANFRTVITQKKLSVKYARAFLGEKTTLVAIL
jgi:hypothetical protein